MKKLLGIVVLGLLLSGCAVEGGRDIFGNIPPGGYATPTSAGENKWHIEGFQIKDAMRGATEFCRSKGKKMEVISTETYTALFKCY